MILLCGVVFIYDSMIFFAKKKRKVGKM